MHPIHRVRRRVAYSSLSFIRNFESRTAAKLRVFIYRQLCPEFGENVYIASNVLIQDAEKLRIGSNVSIHEFNMISCHGGVTIGNDVSIAHGSSILSTSHVYDDDSLPIRDAGLHYGEVLILDNVWVGCGVRILADSIVESGVVVGANSVVRGRLEANSICAGAPARVIRSRINPERAATLPS